MLILHVLILFLVSLCETDADDTLEFKVRIQPRADIGQFSAGDDYSNQLDLYIRRSRLELLGRPTDGVFYILGLSGDRRGQRGASAGGDVAYAFVDYQLGTSSSHVRAGLLKLPFSRGALVSSSRILLIERSMSVSTAAGAFGPYITPHLALLGQLGAGSFRYTLALMDGLQEGDADRFSGLDVATSENPGFVARLEYSPAGWLEGRESDAHLGVGRHLTVAINGVAQSGIEFPDVGSEDRRVLGGDLSFHHGELSFQTEYLRVDRNGLTDTSPSGWYLQVGRYVPRLQLEPAIRFERFDADLDGGNDVTTIYSGGLTWYRLGHDLKFAANIVHTRFEESVRHVADEASRTQILLQNQLYF